MQIPFAINTARDMLAKAKRELDELRASIAAQDKQRIGDALYNFSATAYHIKDWLIKQPGVRFTKQEVEDYVNNNQALSICRDLSNAHKHKNITRYVPETSETTASVGSSIVPSSLFNKIFRHGTTKSPFRLKIITSNGQRLEAVQLGEEIIRTWENFFVKYGL